MAPASTHQPFAFYLGGLVLYLAMTLVSHRIFDLAEARAPAGCPAQRGDGDGLGFCRHDPLAPDCGALPVTLEVWALSVSIGALIGGIAWMRVSGSKPLELFARGYISCSAARRC